MNRRRQHMLHPHPKQPTKRQRRHRALLEALEGRTLLTVTPGIYELDGTQLTNNQTITWQAGIALHVRAVDVVDANHNPTGPTVFSGASNPNNTKFQWDFGDSGALTDPDYTSGVRQSHDSLVGFNAAHIYDTAGTYPLTLTTTDEAGNQASITVNVQVTTSGLGSSKSDVENVIDGNVIYVDSVNGSDSYTGTAPSRVGTTSDGPLASFGAAMAMIRNDPGWNTNVQVRFKRGDTFNITEAANGYNLPANGLIIGAYGATTGARPVLNCNDTSLDSIIFPGTYGTASDWTIQDISFTSSVSSNYVAHSDAVRLRGTDESVRDVTFGNMINDIFAWGEVHGTLIEDNTDNGNWCSNYCVGIVQANTDTVMVGNSFTGASERLDSNGNLTGDQPFVRFESVNQNDNGRILIEDNTIAPTMCNSAALTLREDGSGSGHSNDFLYVADNTVKNFIFNFGYAGGNEPEYLENWTVCDSNTVIDSQIMIQNYAIHTMIRNNLIEHFSAQGTPDAIGENSGGATVGTTGYGMEDMEILNNTDYTTFTGSHAGRFDHWAGSTWHDSVIANNLLVAPNATASSYADALTVPNVGELSRESDNIWPDPKGDGSGTVVTVNNVAMTVSAWNTNYRRAINPAQSDPSYDDVAANISLDSNYAPIGTAADIGVPLTGVLEDMNGKPRTATTWTVGAIDTASVNAPTAVTAAAVSPTQINLTWTDNSNNETGFVIERATNSTFTSNLTSINLAADTTSYSDTGRSSGTTYYYRIRATGAFGDSPRSAAVSVVTPSYGTFSTDGDIGSPNPAGSASYSGGTYTVSGGGSDIFNTSDHFNFLSKSYSGDSAIVADVNSVTDTSSWAKAGVMYRDSTAANAMFADVVITPGQGVSFQYRTTTGGQAASTTISGITAPHWVRLVRNGNVFTAAYSSDGNTWTTIGNITIAMSTNPQVGLAVTSHNDGSLCTATFTNINVYGKPTAPSNLAATVVSASQINLTWKDNSSVETNYIVDRATDSGFTQNLSTATLPAGSTSYSETGLTSGTTYYFRVRATDAVGDSANSATVSATPTPLALTGTIIGTSGSYNNQGNTIAKAFDGDTSTFFDAPTSSGSWVGLDVGTAAVVTQIRYAPRTSYPSRMVGGQFQASNTADFSSGVVTLYTISTAPPTGVLTTVSVTNTTAYRYYRYIGPTGSYCNISELEFDA